MRGEAGGVGKVRGGRVRVGKVGIEREMAERSQQQEQSHEERCHQAWEPMKIWRWEEGERLEHAKERRMKIVSHHSSH